MKGFQQKRETEVDSGEKGGGEIRGDDNKLNRRVNTYVRNTLDDTLYLSVR